MKLKLCKHTSLSKPKRERPFFLLYVVVVFFWLSSFRFLFSLESAISFLRGLFVTIIDTTWATSKKCFLYYLGLFNYSFLTMNCCAATAHIILLIVWLAFLNYSALAQHWERRHNTHKRRGSRWEIATNWTIKKKEKCLLKERAPVLLLLLLVAPQLFGLKINKLMDVGYSSSVTFQQQLTHTNWAGAGPGSSWLFFFYFPLRK